MVTFTCPECNEVRTGRRRRCYPCTSPKMTPEVRARISATMTGRKYSPERVAKSEAGRQAAIAAGGYTPFDIAGYMSGRPPHNIVPTGTERTVKDGRVQIKCPDGKWRYRSRVVWEAHYGPITSATIIHHKDEDPMNDDIDNLQAMTRAEHARHHMLTRKST